MTSLRIGSRVIGGEAPAYFIADIASNHDGQLERAKSLIGLAGAAGANAAKFQHFRASHIVSRRGFEALGSQFGHQAKWKTPVYEVYEGASLSWEWTEELKRHCDAVGIDFLSSPYDFDAVDMLDPYVNCFKIGSGEITWLEMLEKVASKRKPVLLATGAASLDDVQRAVKTITKTNPFLVLMQCNTNYSGSLENFRHIHLNVLRTFGCLYPDTILGLSDHTPGHATVLGAVALGARVIEKHFTDDIIREGPDHAFAMSPQAWREMVDRTRELELALGKAEKRVEINEADTVIVQRRCLRAARDLPPGTVLSRKDIDVLRPAPLGSIEPHEIAIVIGRTIRRELKQGEHITWSHLD